jgi:RimJ/RimL family protein N-acetyltransferase
MAGYRSQPAHVVKMFEYRSASMTVAIHDRAWWGKGVVVKARVRVINHFFRNTEIERFNASVNGRSAASDFPTPVPCTAPASIRLQTK